MFLTDYISNNAITMALLSTIVILVIFIFLLVTKHKKLKRKSISDLEIINEKEIKINKYKTLIESLEDQSPKINSYRDVIKDLLKNRTKLSSELIKVKKKANRIKSDNVYLRTFGNRFRHDCPAYIQRVINIINSSNIDSIDKERARDYLQYIVDIVDVNLHPSIKDRVREKRINPVDTISLRKKLSDLAILYREEISDKHIIIDIQDSVTIPGNWNYLSYAIENLLSNAIEHCYDDGEVQISTRVKDTNNVEIHCYNDGDHLPEEDIGQLFEIGWSNKDQNNGNGYGLYFVNEVIQGFNGQIKVKNTEKEISNNETITGIRFEITLPIQQNPTM